jgi:hypothetical protein
MKNELRIGNLVRYQEDTTIKQGIVYCLNYTNCTVGCKFGRDTVKYSNIEPIPLTEEWLLKFGFIQKNNQFFLENFRFHIEKPCNYDGYIFCDNHIVLTETKHIHQLQNLYFALTNEELIYKP